MNAVEIFKGGGMETINNVELREESIYPDEKVLRSILGQSYEVYENSLNLFDKYEMNYEWRFYHDGKVWLCKVQKKKRTIVWMSAWKGFMQATVYFPSRFLNTVLSLDISDKTKDRIMNAKNIGKSIPCIFEMHSEDVLRDFETVMNLKIACK